MSEASPDEMIGPERNEGGRDAMTPLQGMNPYGSGGGGVTFERKVAVQYLAHLLTDDGATELGDGRRVVRVAFQQTTAHPADDLVVSAAHPDESQPSFVLSIAVRRSPRLVESDELTQKLFRGFVRVLIDVPATGPEHRWGLVVAGRQRHAEQLAKLAGHAVAQMDAPGFFELVHSPGAFDVRIRGRLDQIERLVERGLRDLGVAEVDTVLVQHRAWQLLARLAVCMPRLESPDETDWATVANGLIRVARGRDLAGGLRLRDRLVTLANEYPPKSARVDLTLLRRDAHPLLDATKRRHERGWQMLDHLHRSALASVREEITTSDDARRVRLDRSAASAELAKTAAAAAGVVVSGESGVGKSALALLGLTASGVADPDSVQALCLNLRHLPKLSVEFEATLGGPVSTLLSELSAPRRMLVIDGADAVVEGWDLVFRHLVDAAQKGDVKVVAVTSVDSKQVVLDTLTGRLGGQVTEYAVAPLTDAEIAEIVKIFKELGTLTTNPRSRELLRRLVVVDLLVRGRVRGVPLSDSDAMREVWSGLVRHREMSDRGTPDARELVLLRLASLALGDVANIERLDVINELNPTAIAGLRYDGLLGTSHDRPFRSGPEFAHDEVRRYAVARLLLADRAPASTMLTAGAPRWSLSAARLACQELLAEPDTPTTPVRGRFAELQDSFDELVAAGHGARWGDVPGEALITLASPGAVLRDAWPGLLAEKAAGLRRLARLVDQRLRDDSGVVDISAVQPIIALLLEDRAPWQSGDYAQGLLRSWLRAHVVAETPAGNPLRTLLRERLVEACAAADRRLAEEQAAAAAARAARTPEEIEQERRFDEKYGWALSERGYGGRRRRPEVPYEITDEIVLELLALLGPDLGSSGKVILRRVAHDAPSWLAPAVDDFFAGRALASYGRGLLAHLTEAYYLDDEADASDPHRLGVRSHRSRSLTDPLAAWYLGPFMWLFQTDFRNGVVVLNRLLNHAALVRARTLARLDQTGQLPEDDAIGAYQTELEITGTRRLHVGDEHVWLWYRGTGVGPYPCLSALQALERVCDQLIEVGVPLTNLLPRLLGGCKNIAMVSLIVGLLVRHLEQADHLLDPYLAEPLIWHHEFARVTNESRGFAADSEGLVAPERRSWSLSEAAMFIAVRASDERAVQLRALGETLVANARFYIESTRNDKPPTAKADTSSSIDQELVLVRAWASRLDRDSYQVHETPDGLYIQTTPPEDVVQALQESKEDLERTQEATRLLGRYFVDRKKGKTDVIALDKLPADIVTAQKLLDDPAPFETHHAWDTPALVAATALEAQLLRGADLRDDALVFAADTVLRIAEGEAWPRRYEVEVTLFEQGADRSAARALPLLLVPSAARLRAVAGEGDERKTIERAARGGVNLAGAIANEVRLQLARGLDHVWETPCAEGGRCHHEVGWRFAIETMRGCVLGRWDPSSGRRSVVALKEPFTESLANTDDDSILSFRLDAAIRALAPAAMANVCVSTKARALLSVLLSAQRRSLLRREHHDPDPRGSHTLVSARALLTLAEDGDDAGIYTHLDGFANNSALLGTLLRALSAAAEETPARAATARRIWPSVVRRVLELNESGHTPFRGKHYGDMALAALMPNAASEVSYFHREVEDNPIAWWKPLALQSEVDAWLTVAAGKAMCVDHLIIFLGVLSPEEQIRTGLPWVRALVLPNPDRIAAGSWMLSTWLVEKRSAADATDLLASWQEVVDALVVAGVTRLAPYSD